jgi:putative FmdB family regulatory protein
MPLYRYSCLREAGGCGHEFKEFKPMHARQNVMCPNCSNYGQEQYVDADGVKRYRVEILVPERVNFVSDIDSQDGRIGDTITLSTGHKVSSRRSKKDALRRAREEMFEATDGPKQQMRKFVDPDTGKVSFETVTVNRKGIDHGELHDVEVAEVAKPQRSPFNPNKSIDQDIADTKRELGISEGDEA